MAYTPVCVTLSLSFIYPFTSNHQTGLK